MTVAQAIEQKLQAAFTPIRLIVEDDSASHAGHAGARAGGESHFNVYIVSEAFSGLSRVDRQRRIYQTLSEELAGPIHALALRVLTPAEEAQKTT
ncbi:BolA family protein [Lacibacterium aquatile]|uniref:BolA family protein n=1 Tax=Lacibacterium aquatile TaxID=1168082 RepID=A0ABW5DLW1_9PROT